MSPPANTNSSAVSVSPLPSNSGTMQLPAALLEKCFVPYTRNAAPTLHGHPIAVQEDTKTAPPENALLLSPSLIDLALRILKTEISKPSEPPTLRVMALCTPKLDSALAVDAAVRYLAHHFKADVIILDADDLAAGEHGVLGAEFAGALWSLYVRHYELTDEMNALSPVEREAKNAQDQLARQEGYFEQRKATLAQYLKDNAVAVEPEPEPEPEPTPTSTASADEAAGAPDLAAVSPSAELSTDADVDSAAPKHAEEDANAGDDGDAVGDAERDSPDAGDSPEAAEAPAEDEEDEDLRYLKQDVADADRWVANAREKADACTAALDELRDQHAQRAEVRRHQHAQALSWLRAFLRAGSSPTRRRFLYLRNFGATRYAFLPLVQPLLAAIADCATPVTVLAGFSRVTMMPCTNSDAAEDAKTTKRKHDAYLKALETRTTLLAYVTRKCTPEWRQVSSHSPGPRAASLAGLFSCAVLHRFRVDKLRKRAQETLRVGADARIELVAALAVTLVTEPPAAHRPEVPTRALLADHIPQLKKSLTDDRKQTWAVSDETIVEQWLQLLKEKQPDAKAAVTKLTTHTVHNYAELTALIARIAAWLPQTDTLTTADVFSAIEKSDAADAELQASLALERDGPPKKAESAPSVAEQVKNAKDLDEYEQRLLGAIIDPATITTTYEDVCLQPNIIDTLRSVVSLPLLYAEAYSTGILGRESMAGVLLYGPPGTGKTMVCRALAKESGANMLQIQASTIRSMWHSEDEKLIHATFTLARRLGPCVIFIDEIEAMFGSRQYGGSIHRSTLTEFLQEMDGLKSASENKAHKIVIVGATNRPQDLDEAVLRRLPRRVLVDLPGTSEREKIIKHYLTGEKIDDSVDLTALAERTPHYSGSDLKHLVFSAALSAFKDTVPDLWSAHARKNKDGEQPKTLPQRTIGSHHFEKALEEIVASATTHLASIAELRNWGGSMGV